MRGACLNVPYGARCFLTSIRGSRVRTPVEARINTPYGARCFLTARRVALRDQGERHVGSPVVEKAPLRPASTRVGYQTFRCACMHRRGPYAGPVTPRKSPPLPACCSTITLYSWRVTARLLTGRTDNDDTCRGLVPKRSNHHRGPHSRQTPTPHSRAQPHQSEHPHVGEPHR